MGNCIKGGAQVREDQEIKEDCQDYEHHHEEEENKESGKKVKIVLTKQELERLMFELKANKGRKLEEILQQIESEREIRKIRVWKPSLESITECAEGF